MEIKEPSSTQDQMRYHQEIESYPLSLILLLSLLIENIISYLLKEFHIVYISTQGATHKYISHWISGGSGPTSQKEDGLYP